MTATETRRAWIALILVIAAVTAFRALLIEIFADRTYFAGSDHLRDVGRGYDAFIAILHWLGLDVRAVQIAMTGAVALLAALIAQKLGGVIAAISAAILVLANKAALVNATEIEPETLLLLVCSVALAIVIWSRRWWRLASAAVAVVVIVFLFVSNPGTAFYEGVNPDATGYAGVPPRIVQDIEPSVQTAGARDVAFRIVAARALRRRTSDEDANRFWFDKARAFIDGYRDHAWTLTGRKARLLASGYDAFDTLEMFLANRDLRGVWIPWALLFPLAAAGALLTARRSLAVILYSILAALVPIAFGVTARMRNPLLAGAAILGGLAVPALLDVLHRNAFWAIVVVAFVVTAAVVLSLPDDMQREDEFLLAATHTASELAALGDFATAATWLPERAPAAPGDALHTVALRELAHTKSLPRSLSIAMALLQCGDAAGADEILQRLQSLDYRACRGAHAVSSVAYYR
ncbi:MAG TPA: hypothetical protein VF980_13770, partial [Thermoanaerobaculia bacterium]